MAWVIALLTKSLFALVLFALVFALVALADRLIPPGPIKTFLFKRR